MAPADALDGALVGKLVEPQETETSITGKLARGSSAASFFLACLAVLELEGMQQRPITDPYA